jgi:RNA 3'-terminal phosphate cyclase
LYQIAKWPIGVQAPPLDFLQKAFLPVVNRLGPKIEIGLEKCGFYPDGGGRFIATIEPCEQLIYLSEPMPLCTANSPAGSYFFFIVARRG